MKVLHIFDLYLPATLSWTHRLLLHLEPLQVSVAAPWIIKNQFFSPAFEYHIFPAQRWFFPKVLSETDHATARKIFAGSQRYLPVYIWWLYTRLNTHKPDLLHAHFGPVACLYLPLAKRLKRPLLVTFYGFDYTKVLNLKPFYKEKYHELFRDAAQIIAGSPLGYDLLKKMGCPAEKLSIIPPGIDLFNFPFRVRPKKSGALKLVQMSTITPKKGHLDTLEAFRQALYKCPNLQLCLAGEKWDKDLVKTMEVFIRTHHLSGHITWLDVVDHANAGAFLRQFDVLIHPSCHAPDGDHEDTPVVILEAQSTGLPVISTTHFNIPAEVIHDRTGLLAEEHNPAQLAGFIERFYQMDDAEYQEFSRAARRHVEENFDVRNTAEALRRVYEKVARG